jgi:hypothetical protein
MAPSQQLPNFSTTSSTTSFVPSEVRLTTQPDEESSQATLDVNEYWDSEDNDDDDDDNGELLLGRIMYELHNGKMPKIKYTVEVEGYDE